MIVTTKKCISRCESTDDQPPAYYMIVSLHAESRERIEAILATPAGQAAVADVANFATGGATFMYDSEQCLLGEQD